MNCIGKYFQRDATHIIIPNLKAESIWFNKWYLIFKGFKEPRSQAFLSGIIKVYCLLQVSVYFRSKNNIIWHGQSCILRSISSHWRQLSGCSSNLWIRMRTICLCSCFISEEISSLIFFTNEIFFIISMKRSSLLSGMEIVKLFIMLNITSVKLAINSSSANGRAFQCLRWFLFCDANRGFHGVVILHLWIQSFARLNVFEVGKIYF